MKQRKWLLAGTMLLGAGAIAFVLLANRPSPPFTTIGPHRTRLELVSYADAHRQPIIRTKLFGTDIVFPKPTNVGLGMTPGDELAGFVLIYTDKPVSLGQPPAEVMVLPTRSLRTEQCVVIPVLFGEEPGQFISARLAHESIKIARPYDPTKSPAQYGVAKQQIGPLGITVSLGHVSKSDNALGLLIESKEQVRRFTLTGPMNLIVKGISPPFKFSIPCHRLPDGTLSATAKIEIETSRGVRSFPATFTLNRKEP